MDAFNSLFHGHLGCQSISIGIEGCDFQSDVLLDGWKRRECAQQPGNGKATLFIHADAHHGR